MTDDTGRLPSPTHTGQPSASDERRFGFFMIHNSVVDNFGLTPYEGWLYVIIARHVNQKTGVAFPSLTTLANEGRMSRMQVTRCLKSLQEKGLLEVTPQPITGKRARTTNHYRLLEPPASPVNVVTDSDYLVTTSDHLVTDSDYLVTGSDQGSHSQLLGVVTDSDPNNTNKNKTNEQDEAAATHAGAGAHEAKRQAAAAAAAEPPEGETSPEKPAPGESPQDPADNVHAEVAKLLADAKRLALEKEERERAARAAEPPPPPAPDPFALYEQNIGLMTPLIADELRALEREYPAGWLADAIREAALSSGKSVRYVRSILERWSKDGRAGARPQRRGANNYATPERDTERQLTPDEIRRRKWGDDESKWPPFAQRRPAAPAAGRGGKPHPGTGGG